MVHDSSDARTCIFQSSLSYHAKEDADCQMYAGQLKWRWFRNHRPLEDIVQYDSATRGPLGALSLLLRLRLRHPLSSCGALITVLMLIIDPFAQQIIRYYDCSLSIHGHQATIPRTNLHVSDGTHIGAAQISIPAGIQSAINAGIFSPGGFVTPSCQTGNCSFIQSYSTVGYCGRCTDITNELRFSFTNTTIEYVGSESDSFTSVSVLSYLPSGTSVNSSNTFSPESGAIGNDVWNLATMNHITNCQNQSEQDCMEIIVAKNPTLRDPASGPQSDALSSTCQSGNNTWLCQGYGAASCTLNPCVRTYEASLSSGNFEEISLADTGDGEIWGEQELSGISGRTYLATIDTECITPLEKSSLASAGYLVEPNVHWLPYHLAFDPAIVSNSSFPSSMLEHGCLYVIDDWFVSSLWGSYLTHFFNGTINGFEDENKQINYFNGPQNLQTIYNYGNISFDRVNSIFQNISDAMTTYIRQNGQDNHSNPALGLVMHDETCLEVRWGWLALPAVLVLGTIVFFAAMVIETRPTGGRAHIWKSSPLALIFHGLDEPNSLQTTRVLEENDDMEQRAKEIIVRLANTGGGLNLVASSNMEKRVEGRV